MWINYLFLCLSDINSNNFENQSLKTIFRGLSLLVEWVVFYYWHSCIEISIFKDKNFYILDDPLAAVDAHVAKHLYNKCIMGILQNKTRILCTHHTKYLSEADQIIVMDNGHIANIGMVLYVYQSVP